VTRHSIVRSLLLIGWKVMTTAKGADDVRMIGTEGPDTEVETILGVDTHLEFHLAVALDHLGRRLGEASVPTTAKGYERLLRWAERFGPLRCAGVEGTSSYGAGLARHLGAKGIEVLEVERPERRRRGSRSNLQKSDSSEAEAAARAVLAAEASGVPKSADGHVEMIRALRSARRSAMKARTQAANQLQALGVTAPEELRRRLRGLSTKELSSGWPHASASEMNLATCPRPPGSRCVRWPAVTRPSRARSRSWRRTSMGWWRKPPRSCSLCRASVPTTPRRC
jgi:predicted nuclease with RNAse H fold